jgi:hypothetical protein
VRMRARRAGPSDRPSPMPENLPNQDANEAGIAVVQRWRRSVVRLWTVTMVAALSVWALLAATAVPWTVEALSAVLLAFLTGLAVWNMRRGVCPRCGAGIRFRPRIELPRACPTCAAPFRTPHQRSGNEG